MNRAIFDLMITCSQFDLELSKAKRELAAVVEADIRSAYEGEIARPTLSGIAEYLYEGLMHSHDEDQKAYDAEVAAQAP